MPRNYLESLGGTIVDDATVEADEWRADLSAEKVDIGPSLQLTEITVVFEADDSLGEGTFEELIENFSRKAMRAGG